MIRGARFIGGPTEVAAGTPQDELRLPIAATLAVIITAVVAVGYLMSNYAATPVLAAVRLEIRLAEERPASGLVVAATPGSERLIYLHPEVVLGNDDIAQSWVVDDGSGKFGVGLEFLPEGAARLRQATAGHIGRPVAVLVDGRVVLAPVVRSAIDQSAVITGDFTRPEAERIANGVR